ncbi:hypothetical protein [Aquimarina sp. SS2-1]|uniref:hypothetical protein n=1 Tax=Aquimarina besae TaxID=3342247 RepID=UPI003671C1DE
MKNFLITLFAFTALFGFISCEQDDTDDIEIDIRNINDRLSIAREEHERLLDSITVLISSLENDADFNVNALKMSQNNSLFFSIARQPEVAEDLISASESSYSNFTELLPFSDDVILERGIAMGSLFIGMARQPSASDILNIAAAQFLGEFDEVPMSDDFFVNGRSRGLALKDLFEGVARQPEAFDTLVNTATRFLGDYDAAIFDNETNTVVKEFAIDGLIEGIARNPEAIDQLNSISIQFLGFAFINDQGTFIDEDIATLAKRIQF